MGDEDEVPYQSLYRRFRPQRFSEVLGQEHVTKALRNAVREGRVGHGYLFSGPRGTGKTSTARVLAKALNCEKLDDGEPCGVCESCVAVQQGNSFAVFEMDAASNRGINEIRDLIQRIALGGPGLRKVYIIDEVHHLTTEAATALLKTLEEPPAHVVFVLATTDPQKLSPTIKSRVQHYEFRLMAVDVLQQLVSSINAEARLGLADEDLERVVKRGAGSARDALSVLDQAAALGSAEEDLAIADEVAEALSDRDPARALAVVAGGCASGRDPRRMAEEILGYLRDVFLISRAPAVVDLDAATAARAEDHAKRIGPAGLVRAMERIGEALTDMREALDARITLEVALVRITAPEADTSPAALLERIEKLERRLDSGEVAAQPVPTPRADTAPTPAPAAPAAPAAASSPADPRPVRAPRPAAPTGRGGPASSRPEPVSAPPPPPGRNALGAFRRQPGGQGSPPRREGVPAPGDSSPAPADSATVSAPAPASAAGDLPTRDELTLAWGDAILPSLRGRAKALFAAGRFVSVEDGAALFALPDEAHRGHCLPAQPEVEAAVAAHFGRRVPLRLVTDPDRTPAARGAAMPAPSDDDDLTAADVRELEDAPGGPATPAERVKLAFPGATEVEG